MIQDFIFNSKYTCKKLEPSILGLKNDLYISILEHSVIQGNMFNSTYV